MCFFIFLLGQVVVFWRLDKKLDFFVNLVYYICYQDSTVRMAENLQQRKNLCILMN